MNTQKSIYNKLFKEETQLASHKVELGYLQDVQKKAENQLKNLLIDLKKTTDLPQFK